MNETYALCTDSENESYNHSNCSKEELFNQLKTLLNKREHLRDLYCNSVVLKSVDYQTLRLTNQRILHIQGLIVERIIAKKYEYTSTKNQFSHFKSFLEADPRLKSFQRKELQNEEKKALKIIDNQESESIKSSLRQNIESAVIFIILIIIKFIPVLIIYCFIKLLSKL